LFAFVFKREIYVVMVQFEKIKDRHPDGRERVPRFRRGPLDKSEGPVKTNLSLAMRRHRDIGQRSRRRRLWKASVF